MKSRKTRKHHGPRVGTQLQPTEEGLRELAHRPPPWRAELDELRERIRALEKRLGSIADWLERAADGEEGS